MKKNYFLKIWIGILLISFSTISNAQNKLIHYWNFNNFSGVFNNPTIPSLNADWSAIDSTKALFSYTLASGTSSTYLGYIDNVTGDTINSRMSALAGFGYRFRNPSDSAFLIITMPTTGYKNIVVKYETQTSSTTSGMLQQLYSYSTNNGVNWKTIGLNKLFDSTTTAWKLVSLNFGNDTTVNNNPNLKLKITFAGNTSGTTGNNRFDNFTIEGDTIPKKTLINSINTSSNYIIAFPNPADQSINLKSEKGIIQNIEMVNFLGQIVYKKQSNDNYLSIPTTNFNSGIYTLIITINNNETITKKIYIKH